MGYAHDVVLFDLDGTVQDTYQAIVTSLRYATKQVLGEQLPDEVLTAEVGQPLVTQMRTFAENEEKAQELVRVYRAYNEERLNEVAPLFEGMKELAARLVEEGFTIAIVTSKRRELAKSSMEHFGMTCYLSAVYGLEDSTGHKPDPDPLIQAAGNLGVDLDRCIYVGDSPFDLQAAHRAHIPCVGVTWGRFFSREVLEDEAPDALVDSPDELYVALKELAL